MPPKQCPNCGRFLKKALVEELPEGPQPCPGCSDPLTADLFTEEPAVTASSQGPAADEDDPGSVRPPDLSPSEVRDDASDVLDGWDHGVGAAEIASWDDDRPPFPTDAVVVGIGGAVGALVGALLGTRRLRSALLGTVLGALVAGALRQVWRLPE